MSLFGKLFGAPEKASPSQSGGNAQQKLTSAIQQINEQVNSFEKKKEHIEKRMQAEMEAAKKAVKAARGNKERAKPHLKRRARLNKQLGQIDGIIDNLEAQKFSLETASLNKGAVDAMASGQGALKAQGIDADKLADQLDDIQEDMQGLQEVTDMLSTPMLGEQYDDDELFAEFEDELAMELEDELMDTAGPAAVPDATLDLPDAPTTIPQQPVAAKQETDELAELAAWAN
eukprot:TRINITY_DN10045_c0_g1_i2.p2 TRINITY_DN10045_c0_g1~~TRINITY_DN10045_c0_g1_i2.p2  ORF type:complete len:231 (+),score=67.90 TRINITY_DN10045_c0_g1_i2:2021-2713(+)